MLRIISIIPVKEFLYLQGSADDRDSAFPPPTLLFLQHIA